MPQELPHPPKMLDVIKLKCHGGLSAKTPRHNGFGELKWCNIVSTFNSFPTSTWHIHVLQQGYTVIIVCWETAYQLKSPSYSINKYVGKRTPNTSK